MNQLRHFLHSPVSKNSKRLRFVKDKYSMNNTGGVTRRGGSITEFKQKMGGEVKPLYKEEAKTFLEQQGSALVRGGTLTPEAALQVQPYVKFGGTHRAITAGTSRYVGGTGYVGKSVPISTMQPVVVERYYPQQVQTTRSTKPISVVSTSKGTTFTGSPEQIESLLTTEMSSSGVSALQAARNLTSIGQKRSTKSPTISTSTSIKPSITSNVSPEKVTTIARSTSPATTTSGKSGVLTRAESNMVQKAVTTVKSLFNKLVRR